MSAVLRLVRETTPKPPARDLLAEWSAYMIAYGCSPNTAKTRVVSVRGLIRHARVDDVLELTRDDVLSWLGRPELKQWSRKGYWRSVKSLSGWLAEFGHDPESDLTKGVPQPRTPAVARPIPDAVIDRMLAMKLSPRPHAYVRLALFQALRVHEIAKLRAEDFDLESGWLMVTGKGGITKPIPIHTEIAKLADDMPAVGFWFPGHHRSKPVRPASVSMTISNALQQCGSTATAHQLRDTAATRMQRTVKDIRLTQAMLRHNNITSTMKYTEASNEELRRAVEVLDWQDRAQAPSPAPPAPSLADLSIDELRALTGQLMAELEARE